jgi:hypothetical protein
MFSIMTGFDSSELNSEYQKVVKAGLTQVREDLFFHILNNSKLHEFLPELLASKESLTQLSKLMKIQFNKAVMQIFQSGQRSLYSQTKAYLKDIFNSCHKSEDKQGFAKHFIVNEVIEKGIKMLEHFEANGATNVEEMFVDAKAAVAYVNPYLVRFVTGFITKSDISFLKSLEENCLSILLDLHCFLVLYFQNNKLLIPKLLKSCQKIIEYARKHGKELVQWSHLEGIVSSRVVNFITSKIEYEDQSEKDSFFTSQQLLFLELHIAIESLREDSNMTHGANIPMFLTDTKAIKYIKQSMQILKEKDDFQLLAYLYHLENIDKSDKDRMNKTYETIHPEYNVKTRTHIKIPEVDKMTLKVSE